MIGLHSINEEITNRGGEYKKSVNKQGIENNEKQKNSIIKRNQDQFYADPNKFNEEEINN